MKFTNYESYVQHIVKHLSKTHLAGQPALHTTPESRTVKVLWQSMETSKPPVKFEYRGFFWRKSVGVVSAVYPIRRKLAKLFKAGAKIHEIIYYDPDLVTTQRIAGIVIEIPETFFTD